MSRASGLKVTGVVMCSTCSTSPIIRFYAVGAPAVEDGKGSDMGETTQTLTVGQKVRKVLSLLGAMIGGMALAGFLVALMIGGPGARVGWVFAAILGLGLFVVLSVWLAPDEESRAASGFCAAAFVVIIPAVTWYYSNPSNRSPGEGQAPPSASSPNATVLNKLDAQCSESRTQIDAQADFVRNALRDDFGKTFSKADILEEMQKATSSFTGGRECSDIFATLIVMLGQQ